MLERDGILKLIMEKNWSVLLEFLKDNEKFEKLSNDSIFINLFNQYFIDEILNDPDGKILELTAIYNFHKSSNYNFNLTEGNFKKLIIILVNSSAENIKYAKEFPDDEICKKIIEEYNLDINEKVKENELQQKFSVNQIIKKSDESFVISIFKSPQEKEFYFAAERIFNDCILLPNIALSSVINNNVIDKLEKNKKWHFLSTTIDLVIIDKVNFKPIHFFELDSSFHDTEEQKLKDKIKNDLITEAGHEIIRIRKKTGEESIEDFEKLLIKYKP